MNTKWIPLTVVSIFTQTEFLWLLCQYSHQMNSFDCRVNIHTKWIPLTVVSIFWWISELLRTQPCRFALYQWIAENVGSEFDTFAPYSGLVHGSLTQTSGHKLAVLTVMFRDFQTSVFNKQRVGRKRLCVHFLFIFKFHSDRQASGVSSVQIRYRRKDGKSRLSCQHSSRHTMHSTNRNRKSKPFCI